MSTVRVAGELQVEAAAPGRDVGVVGLVRQQDRGACGRQVGEHVVEPILALGVVVHPGDVQVCHRRVQPHATVIKRRTARAGLRPTTGTAGRVRARRVVRVGVWPGP